MSGFIARILLQAAIAGSAVVVKAFVQAYQRVAANPEAAKAAAEAAKKTVTRKEMTVKEALQVLNFDKPPASLPALEERFNKYYLANDTKKGGSFYVQSKVYRARESLLQAMGLDPTKVPPPQLTDQSAKASDASKQ